MILYKYKALEAFHQTTDLLLMQRLYCPKLSELNDPLEGFLGVSHPEDPKALTLDDKFAHHASFWFAADELLNRYRICSFSGSPDNPLMWSYYGNGHSGICLQLDLSDFKDEIIKVEYVDDLSIIDQSSIKSLLRYKLVHWKHEDEYRLILGPESKGKYIKAAIKSVIIGGNLREEYIMQLFEICKLMNYSVEVLTFSTSGESLRLPLNMK
jgi:hypothetical protein